MQSPTHLAWPPAYTIKKHRRAKHVKLRAAGPYGLEITIPCRFNMREIPFILEENKVWIIRQLLRLQTQPSDVLPEKIVLNAVNETWSVHYAPCQARLEIIHRPHNEIVLAGKTEDKQACIAKLTAWLKAKAKPLLIEHLQRISKQIQLDFNGVTIRDQKTLWGSCTAAKAISLNYKLVLLPTHLMTYVIIHELCHTVYLNHSEKFWALVAKHDPACQMHRKELRLANQFIPGWLVIN